MLSFINKEVSYLHMKVIGRFLFLVSFLAVVFVLVSLLVIQKEDTRFVCNAPYIEYGSACCLDENSNLICDNDEIIESSDGSKEDLDEDPKEEELIEEEEEKEEEKEEEEEEKEEEPVSFDLDYDQNQENIYSLSDLPSPFVKSNIYSQENIFVLGDLSADEYITALIDITFYFQTRSDNVVEATVISAIDLEDIKAQNLVVIGSPCTNPLVELVTGHSCDSWPYGSNEGIIEVLPNHDKGLLVVYGLDESATTLASKALLSYTDYIWCGNRAIVTMVDEELIVTMVDEECSYIYEEPEAPEEEPE
jgi:hypothetical protein